MAHFLDSWERTQSAADAGLAGVGSLALKSKDDPNEVVMPAKRADFVRE
jgi:hypothetical protein